MHIERGRRAKGENPARRFLGQAGLDHLVVEVIRLRDQAAGELIPLALAVLGEDVHAVLAVGLVLDTLRRAFRDRCTRIAGAELLEAERPVAQNLSGDVTLGVDADAKRRHLEGGPVAVFDQVAKEARASVPVIGVVWVGDACHLDD